MEIITDRDGNPADAGACQYKITRVDDWGGQAGVIKQCTAHGHGTFTADTEEDLYPFLCREVGCRDRQLHLSHCDAAVGDFNRLQAGRRAESDFLKWHALYCQEAGCPHCKPRAVRLDPNAVIQVEVVEEIRPTHRATIVVDFFSDPDGSSDLAQSMGNRLAVEFGHVGARVHAEVRKL